MFRGDYNINCRITEKKHTFTHTQTHIPVAFEIYFAWFASKMILFVSYCVLSHAVEILHPAFDNTGLKSRCKLVYHKKYTIRWVHHYSMTFYVCVSVFFSLREHFFMAWGTNRHTRYIIAQKGYQFAAFAWLNLAQIIGADSLTPLSLFFFSHTFNDDEWLNHK